jgi:hypothetical protein
VVCCCLLVGTRISIFGLPTKTHFFRCIFRFSPICDFFDFCLSAFKFLKSFINIFEFFLLHSDSHILKQLLPKYLVRGLCILIFRSPRVFDSDSAPLVRRMCMCLRTYIYTPCAVNYKYFFDFLSECCLGMLDPTCG